MCGGGNVVAATEIVIQYSTTLIHIAKNFQSPCNVVERFSRLAIHASSCAEHVIAAFFNDSTDLLELPALSLF